jgi:hypothetical protein
LDAQSSATSKQRGLGSRRWFRRRSGAGWVVVEEVAEVWGIWRRGRQLPVPSAPSGLTFLGCVKPASPLSFSRFFFRLLCFQRLFIPGLFNRELINLLMFFISGVIICSQWQRPPVLSCHGRHSVAADGSCQSDSMEIMWMRQIIVENKQKIIVSLRSFYHRWFLLLS